MDTAEAAEKDDCFLRDIPNVKISQEKKKESPKNYAKEEIKVLHLSENSQQMVMETLRFIHGRDFVLSDSSEYKDDNTKFMNKYLQQNSLVVKGGFHHTEDNNATEEERIKVFALLRLESYGFHKSHCEEALEYTNGNLEAALNLLYSKYMKIEYKITTDHGMLPNELLEQRKDEKGVLESIYESAFKEKVANSVWIITLKLDYIVDLLRPTKSVRKPTTPARVKKKPLCRLFLDGNCKFGLKCRFSHEIPEPVKITDPHLNLYTFDLEIRFPENTTYPFEPPLVFLKSTYPLPELLGLHICRSLYKEAVSLAHDGMPSVYSIAELLKNEDVMKDYLKTTDINFILASEKLFPPENGIRIMNQTSHFKKGVTSRRTKGDIPTTEITNENRRIAQKFVNKAKEDKYLKMIEIRKSLPAWKLKHDIINTIESSQVTVISGETGCGKSTQVPQFLLDNWLENYENKNNNVNIVCTQPRRISAIGVAERVADERNERIGNTVGYQIRLENKISASTRLTFCTTGILLRRLESEPSLPNVTHIVVDEVHERSEESDFLLLILKDLLKVRADLKVILMSATMNADLFVTYFSNTPVLEIPGRTFPVTQYFLEDVLEETNFILEENTQYTRKVKGGGSEIEDEFERLMGLTEAYSESAVPKASISDEKLSIVQTLARYKGYSLKTCKNLYLMDPDKINLDLIEAVLAWITSFHHDFPKTGSILIFLPGIAEIMSLYDQLNDSAEFSPRKGKFILVPLHSSLTSEEQAAIFKKPPVGVRKIVLSTNLAETSVTIDDCVFVVDCGKMKEKRFDSSRNMESLDTVWVTKANALQRKGRAGRVMPGVAIHLVTSHRFQHHFLPQPVPEIHRIPLEQLLLHIKILPSFSGKSLHDVLGSMLEPPVAENINSAIKRLEDVGAFDKHECLTPLGCHLAGLPVDVRIGKLILYGAIFSCIDATLTVAAALNYRSPFVSPFGKREEAMEKKKKFACAQSDHLTVLAAYRKWQEKQSKSHGASYNFANENYMSLKTLETLADIKYQLLELLVDIGFIPINLSGHRHRSGKDIILSLTGSQFNKNDKNVRLLSSILCTALYPNIIKVLSPQTKFLRSAAGAVPIQTEAKQLRFKTKMEEVFLHPSSVNFSTKTFSSPYLVYQEKVQTSKIYIRDCSMVPLVPLVLFSGSDVDIFVNGGISFLSLADRWIQFQVEDHKVAEMVKAIRRELLHLLEEKIKDPLLNICHHERGERIIDTIVHIASKD